MGKYLPGTVKMGNLTCFFGLKCRKEAEIPVTEAARIAFNRWRQALFACTRASKYGQSISFSRIAMFRRVEAAASEEGGYHGNGKDGKDWVAVHWSVGRADPCARADGKTPCGSQSKAVIDGGESGGNAGIESGSGTGQPDGASIDCTGESGGKPGQGAGKCLEQTVVASLAQCKIENKHSEPSEQQFRCSGQSKHRSPEQFGRPPTGFQDTTDPLVRTYGAVIESISQPWIGHCASTVIQHSEHFRFHCNSWAYNSVSKIINTERRQRNIFIKGDQFTAVDFEHKHPGSLSGVRQPCNAK